MSDLKVNPWAELEDIQEGEVPTATLEIYKYIGSHLEREKDNNVNRASAATMCVKRRWYQHHDFEGTPLTPRKMINFMLGDLTEKVLQHFIKQALVGPGKLYAEVDFGKTIGTFNIQGKPVDVYTQKTLSFKLPDGTPITGHADGFGRRNSDGCWELIEIKSSADGSFNYFKTVGPERYLNQSHALFLTEECKALGIKQVRFFYLKKQTGNIYDKLFSYNSDTANVVISEFNIAKGEEEPEKPHGLVPETYRKKPTGRIVAKFPCTYCPYLEHCQGPHEKEFKSNKPNYVFKEKPKLVVAQPAQMVSTTKVKKWDFPVRKESMKKKTKAPVEQNPIEDAIEQLEKQFEAIKESMKKLTRSTK